MFVCVRNVLRVGSGIETANPRSRSSVDSLQDQENGKAGQGQTVGYTAINSKNEITKVCSTL
jgi:hypothetical protein